MKSKFMLFSALLVSTATFAQQNASTNGEKHALLEKFTGAWCPYCADGVAKFDELFEANPKAMGAAIHNGDAMVNGDGAKIDKAYTEGYPTACVNRRGGKAYSRSDWKNLAKKENEEENEFDLVMTHSYDQATRTLTVNLTAKAVMDMEGDWVLNAYLTEDKLTGKGTGWDQANADNGTKGHRFYGKGSPIVGFEHNHVHRDAIGDDAWGTEGVIPTNPKKGSEYTAQFVVEIPAKFNIDNMHILGFVAASATDPEDREIANAIEAKLFPWSTGVNIVNNFVEIQIFPNPATDFVNVRALLNTPAETNVTITNAVGQVVFNHTYAKGSSLFGEQISLNGFTNGVYFVNVSSGEAVSHVEKITINK